MNILIATGIYPPDLGGPAQYAYNLEKIFRNAGHTVSVKYFTSVEKILPTGLRHVYYLVKSVIAFLRADHVLVLDTFSAAGPIYALSCLFGKKYTVRTGGDFLWESYIERTKKKVLFSQFYQTEISNFTKKEQFIYMITQKILRRAKTVVFSTTWQRDIFITAYDLDATRTTIIENYFDIEKHTSPAQVTADEPTDVARVFITGSRDLVWKNKDILLPVLKRLQADFPDKNIAIDNNTYQHKDFLGAIERSYAVVLMSLGDISPNTILDSIRKGKPFLLTEENGITTRVRELGLFANPLDSEDIYKKLVQLLDQTEYARLQTNIKNFAYTHTWEEIMTEYLTLWK